MFEKDEFIKSGVTAEKLGKRGHELWRFQRKWKHLDEASSGEDALGGTENEEGCEEVFHRQRHTHERH